MISYFTVIFVMYFVNDFEMVPVGPLVTGINFDYFFFQHALYLYHMFFIFYRLLTFFLGKNSVSWNYHFNQHTFSCFVTTLLRCPVYCYEWLCQFFHFMINNMFSLSSWLVSSILVKACTTFDFIIYCYYSVIFCEVFTIIYLKIPTLLGYIML